jgi:MFS family permease
MTAPPVPSPKTDWPVIAWAVAGGIVAALSVGKVPPALPFVRADLGLGLVEGGFVVSVFNTLAMVLGLIVGVMADRLGRRRLLGLGFACLAGGGVLGAASDGLSALLVSRFVEGIGFILVAVSSPAIVIAAAAPRDRALALSLWSVFTPAGMALALIVAPPLLHALDWRALWLAIAGAGVVALVGVTRATRRVVLPQALAGSPLRTVAETLARPGLRWLALAFAAYAFQWVSLMVWLPTFLAADLGATVATAALLTALVVAVNVPSNVLAGWLLGRGVPRAVLMVGGSAAFFTGIRKITDTLL